MATRARLSQDRSRLRREELLDAAIELFAERGARGITHRLVTAAFLTEEETVATLRWLRHKVPTPAS